QPRASVACGRLSRLEFRLPLEIRAVLADRLPGRSHARRRVRGQPDRQPVRHSGEPVRRDARGLEQGATMSGYEPPMTVNRGQIALLAALLPVGTRADR